MNGYYYTYKACTVSLRRNKTIMHSFAILSIAIVTVRGLIGYYDWFQRSLLLVVVRVLYSTNYQRTGPKFYAYGTERANCYRIRKYGVASFSHSVSSDYLYSYFWYNKLAYTHIDVYSARYRVHYKRVYFRVANCTDCVEWNNPYHNLENCEYGHFPWKLGLWKVTCDCRHGWPR